MGWGSLTLEGAVIACSRRVKRVDRTQDRIDIFAASAVVLVDVCKDKLAIPIALQETEDLWSLRYAARTSLTNLSCKGVALHESAMLDCCSEERRACRDLEVSISFLPT